MALLLRRGLETNPDFQDRLAFLVNHRVLWGFGWFTWTAAALAILYFYIAFASAHQAADPSNIWLRFAVILTAAAIGPDLAAQTIEIGVLPGIAYRVLKDREPALAARSLAVARDDWEHAIVGIEGPSTWHTPAFAASRMELAGIGITASIEL